MFWWGERERARRGGVDCGDYGGVVLEFVKVLVCGCAGEREGVRKEGIVWAEGEVGDYVGEVEFCRPLVTIREYVGRTYGRGGDACRIPCSRGRGR